MKMKRKAVFVLLVWLCLLIRRANFHSLYDNK